jgi:hypothetical protein
MSYMYQLCLVIITDGYVKFKLLFYVNRCKNIQHFPVKYSNTILLMMVWGQVISIKAINGKLLNCSITLIRLVLVRFCILSLPLVLKIKHF